MRGNCLLAAGLCAGMTAMGSAQAQSPARTPAFPATLADSKPVAAATQPPGWSAQDIQLAKARCTALLKGLDVVAIPEPPLKDEGECGTPAPMRLISIGKQPEVAFSPPPVVTCDMIAALHKWMQRDVQPLARKLMSAPVVRVETMSSYSCRNAYGRAGGRLSEHGRANAIDIGSFVTALGQGVLVLSDWGPTARDSAATVAETKMQDAAPVSPVAVATQNPGKQDSVLGVAPSPEPLGAAATAAISGFSIVIPGVKVQFGGESAGKAAGPAPGSPSRLGGPKAGNRSSDAYMDFLRAAHKAACKHFGTVLGPEANTAHRNHFHLDMAERPHGVICE